MSYKKQTKLHLRWCPICANRFIGYRKNTECCSRNCRDKYRRLKAYKKLCNQIEINVLPERNLADMEKLLEMQVFMYLPYKKD